jgi:hypothetical protein
VALKAGGIGPEPAPSPETTPLASPALARSGAIRGPLRPLTWACAFGPAPRHGRAASSKSDRVRTSQTQGSNQMWPQDQAAPSGDKLNGRMPPQAAPDTQGTRFQRPSSSGRREVGTGAIRALVSALVGMNGSRRLGLGRRLRDEAAGEHRPDGHGSGQEFRVEQGDFRPDWPRLIRAGGARLP